MFFDRYVQEKVETVSLGVQPKWVSAAKAVSWRMVGTIDTFIISFIITGKGEIAFSIASVEVISKVVLYYLHERVWERVRIKH